MAKNNEPVEFAAKLARVRIEPDDILVVRVKTMLTPNARKAIADAISTAFPDNECIVLDDDTDLAVLHRTAVHGA